MHFYRRPVLVGYCFCVSECVEHELVRAITHLPFTLGSPNFNHKCKITWVNRALYVLAWNSNFTGFWACHTFLTTFLSSYHHEIFTSYLLPMREVMSIQMVKVKGHKVTEVKSQFSRFRTITAVWIHIWWWNGAQSLMLPRRGALLFFKIIRQSSGSYCFSRPSIKFQGHTGAHWL